MSPVFLSFLSFLPYLREIEKKRKCDVLLYNRLYFVIIDLIVFQMVLQLTLEVAVAVEVPAKTFHGSNFKQPQQPNEAKSRTVLIFSWKKDEKHNFLINSFNKRIKVKRFNNIVKFNNRNSFKRIRQDFWIRIEIKYA